MSATLERLIAALLALLADRQATIEELRDELEEVRLRQQMDERDGE